MISYPEAYYAKTLTLEMRRKTQELPLYRDGPAVDYTNAPYAYALNATLLHDPHRHREEVLANGPSDSARILLVERASGHGRVGSFSGVSGYIDTLYDPYISDSDTSFDPIAHTLQEELMTECGFTEEVFHSIDFYAGYPSEEVRTIFPDAKISVVPILGLCASRPYISVDKTELASHKWIELKSIRYIENLSRGYLSTTLPAALGAIWLKDDTLMRLID